MIRILILLPILLFAACQGTQGPPGPPGSSGDGGVEVQELARVLAADPDLRRELVKILVEEHADELRGPQGEMGPEGPPGRDGESEEEEPVPVCQPVCNTSSDCAEVGGFAAANWTCVDGACRYLGCFPGDCSEPFVCK